MWHTPEGTRVLGDLEGEILRVALQTAVELIELGLDAGSPWIFGVEQFDALTPGQQLALLAEVGQALLNEDVQSPDHSAINEAAVYVIYRAVLTAIDFEIDGNHGSDVSVRQMVSELLAQPPFGGFADDEEDDVVPLAPDCCDRSEWQFAIECIADGVLWDRDFELGDLIVDSSPERANFVKSFLGIDDDFFMSIASDPIDLTEVKQTLESLTRSKPR